MRVRVNGATETDRNELLNISKWSYIKPYKPNEKLNDTTQITEDNLAITAITGGGTLLSHIIPWTFYVSLMKDSIPSERKKFTTKIHQKISDNKITSNQI